MNRRTFFGLLSGLLGIFGVRQATAASPLPKPLPEAIPVKPEVIEETDLWAMFDHIVDHVYQTGEAVFPDDEPMRLRIGFTCDSKGWRIPLVKIKAGLITPPPDQGDVPGKLKVELVQEYISTIEGRRVLCVSLGAAGLNRRKLRSAATLA